MSEYNIEEKVILAKLKSSNQTENKVIDEEPEILSSFETLKKNIKIMEVNASVTAYSNIVTNFRLLSGVVILVKKLIRRCLKWYIEPVCMQQSIFNRASTMLSADILSMFGETGEERERQRRELELQKQELENYREELELQKQELEKQRKEFELQKEELLSQKNEMESLCKNIQFIIEQNLKLTQRIDNIKEEAYTKPIENFFLSREAFAQSGEDIIVEYILMVLGIKPSECRYLDLGANHARELSNTYSLYKKGARGVLVEANPALIPELKFYRHEDVIINKCISNKDEEKVPIYILNGDGLVSSDKESVEKALSINNSLKLEGVIEVESIHINKLLEQYFVQGPEILSVDIESDSLNALKAVDWERFRPLIVIVEMIEYSTELSVGYKDKEIQQFMETQGYIEYAFTGINSIYLDRRKVVKL